MADHDPTGPPTSTGGRPRLFTAAQLQELGRCGMCEHHVATQGHHYTCPAWPDWHVAGGKPNRPYIPPPVDPRTGTVTPSADYLDLDVTLEGDQAP